MATFDSTKGPNHQEVANSAYDRGDNWRTRDYQKALDVRQVLGRLCRRTREGEVMIEATWTQVDRELIRALACQVRVLSREQIHRGWNDEVGLSELDLRLRVLTDCGLLRSEIWRVAAPPVRRSPVFTWEPGDANPDTWRLSTVIRHRWKSQPVVRTSVFSATTWAARLFGSRAGQISRRIEQRHDLLLGEVYTLYRQYLPELAFVWIGELSLPMAERRVKNPDAFLLDDGMCPRRVVESAGAYSQLQVATFHRYCELAQIPYELW